MSCEKLFVGQTFQVSREALASDDSVLDCSTASEMKAFYKNDEGSGSYDMTLVDGTLNNVITAKQKFDVAGDWIFQVYIKIGGDEYVFPRTVYKVDPSIVVIT